VTVRQWFNEQGFRPAKFQTQTWASYGTGHNGLIIAPTGSGKTYAVMGAVATDAQNRQIKNGGLRLLWITPLKALSSDIAVALRTMSEGLELGWDVALRTGDTSSSAKTRQRKSLPEVLVTTPESLHIMLSYPESAALFTGLECIAVDEWHDVLGSKRGVMLQLALARLRSLAPQLHVWGISATIGNIESAMHTLLAAQTRPAQIIQDARKKKLNVTTVIPSDIERFPWAGHLGDRQLDRILTIIMANRSTLVFTNTRNQAERWYQKLLAREPELAGQIALHHGSLAPAMRIWVEEALHDGKLRAVVCTSSLDLGVDFRPVDTVIQIGGPKGVARFLQRAGRSGHSPNETSNVYFVPTNALELFEAAALKLAIAQGAVESIHSPKNSLDVLCQWLVTLGIGDGVDTKQVYQEIISTDAYHNISPAIWKWAIAFVTSGGSALHAYEHYRKLEVGQDGQLYARNKDIIRRHRSAIGAITSSAAITVQVLRGQSLGSIEETFAGSLKAGQTFWFSGRILEFVRLSQMTLWVRPSRQRSGITPSWNGGRLPLSNQLASGLRHQVAQAANGQLDTPELVALRPLLRLQASWSKLPHIDELLVEQFKNREGYHTVMYPFEGRATHEVMATLIAIRLGRDPNTFSLTHSDYGFEILSALPSVMTEAKIRELLSTKNLNEDVHEAISSGTLPRRQFRAIATIAGLVTPSLPGRPQSTRHLQASSEMMYDTLRTYDADNKLLEQAYTEVLDQVIDMNRLRQTLQRVASSNIVLTSPLRPTPLAFPLIAERLRERLSTEQLSDRIARMQIQLERYASGI
jgi:ATP-dependent Lhr-like helicase